jgi:hypothetical protein
MVMIVQGDVLTVRDLLDYVANAAGAVHFGNPTKDKRPILRELDQHITLGGVDTSLRCLLAVCWITRDALDPLVKAIRGTG